MEDPEPSLTIAGILLCLLLLAFTSAVDASFSFISRHRLNALLTEQGSRARAIFWLIDDPYRFKSTILILNLLAVIVATALTLDLAARQSAWWRIGSLALLLMIMLVVSEVLPKALAARNPHTTALLLAGPLSLITRLLWPLTSLVNLLMRPLFSLISGQKAPSGSLVTEEELRLLVNVGEEEGLIEHEEREMIEGVMAFGDTLLREIMVPRIDIVAIDIDATLEEALNLVIARGHSRIPVYDGTLDRIEGILYAKDLLPALRDGDRELPLRILLRSAHFVPETIRVNALLQDLQQRKVHLAIAVDEYGGVSGLATIEDLIEQIVGEIQDEYDREEPAILEVEPGVYLVEATVPIDEINAVAGIGVESEDADRIGGLVAEVLGRIPRVGDEVIIGEARISVLSAKGVRVEKLRISRRPVIELNKPVSV